MKENGRKAPGPCHQEHVQVLNHLTDTLKDELKRGLTLLDNCVNQLAQAKWILINVERTMEDFYTDCPACDGAPRGNRATTPPSVVNTQANVNNSGSTNTTSKKSSAKAKKASVLPMVSGHTVQRPKINIARVDARTSKKAKRTDSTSGGAGRGRSRGRSSATATSVPEDTDGGTPNDESAVTSSRKKLKPGPRSKTRIIATGGTPASSFVDGDDVAVELNDIGYLLDGRESFKGAELATFTGEANSTEDHHPEPKASSSSTLENSDKKRKHDTSDDEEEEKEAVSTIKKKTEEQSTKLKTLSTLKSSTAPSGPPVKPDLMKSLIQQTFLKFAKGKPNLKKDSTSGGKASTPSQKSNNTTGSDKKGMVSDDESVTASVKSVDKNKKEKSDKKVSDESNNDSEDENLATLAEKKVRAVIMNKKSRKKSHSSDDSDYEVSQSAKKSPKKSRKTTKVTNMSDSSDAEDNSTAAKRKSGRGNSKKNWKESSDESDTVQPLSNSKRKSPARSSSSRRESKDEDKTSDCRGRQAKEKAISPVRQTKSPERKIGPASKVNTAKRTGGKPGPLSAKLREAKEKKDRESDDKKDDGSTDGSKSKKAAAVSAVASAVVFTDSEESDNSVLRSTIKNIPLDLQDAARSPSPQNTTDIFGRLLSTYNKNDGSFEKLKKRAKYIKNKVYELESDLQEKLSSVGRELVPFTGSIDGNKNIFTIGKYYIVGKGADEKLVFFDSSSELQELDLSSDDLDELLED